MYVWARQGGGCFYRLKITKLKAIHNIYSFLFFLLSAVFIDSKLQNWKQFTTWENNVANHVRCFYRLKITKLKAIHNIPWCWFPLFFAVFIDSKLQNWKQFTTSLHLYSSYRMMFLLFYCLIVESLQSFNPNPLRIKNSCRSG